MSVDYTAIIARGFLIDECPYRNEKFPDEFVDEWIIDFDCWDTHTNYLVGYKIKSCEAGIPYEAGHTQGDPMWDDFLREACRKAGIPVGEIKTYFGVRVS